MDVDGHGRITVSPYISPALRTPVVRFDLADARGIVEDGVEMSSDYATAPGEAVVRYQYTDDSGKEHDIVGFAQTVGEFSKANRGYYVTRFETLSEMNPATEARAQTLAKSYLSRYGMEKVEWTLNVSYIPLHEGDTVELVVHDGYERYTGIRLCLVKTLSLDLSTMMMRLSLKETNAPDEET